MATLSEIDCVKEQVPLADRTWLKLGGAAKYFAEPTSVGELKAVVERCRDEPRHVHLLRGGSTVLVRDEARAGMVISLSHPSFAEITTAGPRVTVGGGANLAHAITVTVGAGLAGLEPLVGIPGTICGALHGNSGSHGGDIGQWAS